MPDGVTPGWFDFRPTVGPHAGPDVKGKRCLDVWTFDESLRFEMAGYRVTNLAGDPGYRGASKGAGLALRDSVVHPTSAFASRHRQPGSADTFGSAVVTEDDLRRYSLMQVRVHRSAAAPAAAR